MPSVSSVSSSDPKAEAAVNQVPRFSIVVGIATRGRPAILKETLANVLEQNRPAEGIFVAYSELSDVGDAPEQFPHIRFTQGPGGSCAQRNHLLDAVGEAFDLVFFMDDDFYLHRDYLLQMERAFAEDAAILGATGTVIADGAKGPGLSSEYARSILAALPSPSTQKSTPVSVFNTYGCNMTFRAAALRDHNIRFDEQLPAYGWYEDIDLSRRLLPFGRLVRVPYAIGVHLGVKVGRTSGKRFGYSQIANPIYLARKGTYPWANAARSMARHVFSNLLHSIAPEPYLDRRGRIQGNFLAFWEFFRGRMHPSRILHM